MALVIDAAEAVVQFTMTDIDGRGLDRLVAPVLDREVRNDTSTLLLVIC